MTKNFLTTSLSRNSHKRLELKENQTKCRNMTESPEVTFWTDDKLES